MTVIQRNLLLEDAYFFLNQAKSLSDTPRAKTAKQRYTRVSIVLSWAALEAATKDTLTILTVSPLPYKLFERLKMALTNSGTLSALDWNAYRRLLKMRNDIVHANSGSPEPLVRDAEETFTFSKKLIRALIPPHQRFEIQIESLLL